MPNKSGFSLLEAVLYLSVVAILLTAVVSFHMTLGGTSSKLAASVAAARNRRVALSSIDYLVRNADGLLKDTDSDCSNFSSSPEVLALYFNDDTYLPGTCVVGGGGVRISVDASRVKLTCYPNIPYNNWYGACDAGVFTAGNSYYLTSPDVQVASSNLSFSTSTATSTSNGFLSVTTDLTVNNISSGQISLSATSTASSTVVMRNEQSNGLVAYWTLEGGAGTDYSGQGNTVSCGLAPPDTVAGLIDGSSNAWDFNSAASDTCVVTNKDILNFTNAFSIAAWIKEDDLGSERSIINKSQWSSQTGYKLSSNSGQLLLRVYDSSSYTDYTSSYTMTASHTYHVAATYSLNNDNSDVNVVLYVFEKDVGGVATTTLTTSRILVNYNSSLYWSLSNYFNGVVDDVRLYNRVLTNEEIWALQSQGAP